MKHAEEGREAVGRILGWLKWPEPLASAQWTQLESFVTWLNDEAVRAGGIGPHESERIWTRHIADSLSFAVGWPDGPPSQVLDVGAGVGLPGIPLAILWPQTQIILLDRSDRRLDLARRAVRRLGLENVDVQRGDALEEPSGWESAVFRAVFPPARARDVADALCRPEGRAVVGIRGRRSVLSVAGPSASGRSLRIVEVPATVLDGAVSLLIMEPSEH